MKHVPNERTPFENSVRNNVDSFECISNHECYLFGLDSWPVTCMHSEFHFFFVSRNNRLEILFMLLFKQRNTMCLLFFFSCAANNVMIIQSIENTNKLFQHRWNEIGHKVLRILLGRNGKLFKIEEALFLR